MNLKWEVNSLDSRSGSGQAGRAGNDAVVALGKIMGKVNSYNLSSSLSLRDSGWGMCARGGESQK